MRLAVRAAAGALRGVWRRPRRCMGVLRIPRSEGWRMRTRAVRGVAGQCAACVQSTSLRAAHVPWSAGLRTQAGASYGVDRDTIVQLSSGSNRAGVAVVRVSGPEALEVLRALSGKTRVPEPRKATMCKLFDPQSGEMLDSQALALYFPTPRSFTGEDVVELHVHGNPIVVSAVIAAASRVGACRPAEAGEFTRRAFRNGKLDLTQIEGLADLLNAETEQQRRQAIRQMDGHMGALFESWRTDLTRALAYVEAVIDFAEDETDVGEEEIIAHVRPTVEGLIDSVGKHLNDDHVGEIVRDGLRVAIFGPPNAGKSSLLNWLARRPVAIVSEHAGTTRDVLEVPLNLGGFTVTVADTAGLRDTANEVEEEGIRRALARVEDADIKLAVMDASDVLRRSLAWQFFEPHMADGQAMVVLNKADLVPDTASAEELVARLPLPQAHTSLVSCKTGLGLDGFLESLQGVVQQRLPSTQVEDAVITRARHRECLASCLEHLHEFQERDADGDLVASAEELRLAVRSLGQITGRVDVESLLDTIFSDFCIGK